MDYTLDEFYRTTRREGDCLIWTGPTRGTEQPRFGRETAYRWVYQHEVAPIPARMVVMHSCDRPLCVEIDHLSVGTQSDNMQDMVAKGRWSNGYPSEPVRVVSKYQAPPVSHE